MDSTNNTNTQTNDTEAEIAKAVSEYQQLVESGQRPDRVRFLEQHVAIAAELEKCIEAIEFVGRVLPDSAFAARSQNLNSDLNVVEVGTFKFTKYRIIREIGRGGMGIVFEAEDLELGRRVALKALAPHLARDADAKRRFRREARSAGKLQHPNIVPIHEVSDESESSLYLTMQLIRGVGLDQVIAHLKGQTSIELAPWFAELNDGAKESSPSPWVSQASDVAVTFLSLVQHFESRGMSSQEYYRCVAKIGQQIASALSYAHHRGILHRDIKPSNVMLDANGVAFVSDFGLAKDLEENATLSTDLAGTIKYMAPERFSGVVDVRSDVYSLGLVLFELATLRPAFDDRDRAPLIDTIRTKPLLEARVVEPRIPRDLSTIIAKAVSMEPPGRYLTAADLADDLNRFLTNQSINARVASPLQRAKKWTRRHPSLAALLISILVATVATTVLWLRSESSRIAEQSARERAERIVYSRDIAAADFEYHANKIDRSRTILENSNPLYRNWEWKYLSQRLRQSTWDSPYNPHSASAVAISKDGRFVSYGYGRWGSNTPQEICVWDIHSNEVTCRIQGLSPCYVGSLEFSPDGTSLVGSLISWRSTLSPGTSSSGGFYVWDVPSGMLRFSKEEQDSYVSRVSIDGESIYVGEVTGSIKRYAMMDGALLDEYVGSSGFVTDIEFSPDATRLVATARDGTLCIWNLLDGSKLHQLTGLSDPRTVSWSTCEDRLLVKSYTGNIYSFDVRDQKLDWIDSRKEKNLRVFSYSPDGTHVVSSAFGTGIQIRDAKRFELEQTIPAHSGHIRDIAWDGSGQRIVSCGVDTKVHVWDLSRQDDMKRTSVLRSGLAVDFAYSPTEPVIALAIDKNPVRDPRDSGQPRIEIRNRNSMAIVSELYGHSDWLTCVAYSQDGTQLISGSADKTVRVWNTNSGAQLFEFSHHLAEISDVAFVSKDIAVSADRAGRVCVWRLDDGKLARSWESNNEIVAISMLQRGSVALIGAANGELSFWSVSNGQCLGRRQGLENLLAMDVSPNGQWIATGHENPSIQLWRTAELLQQEGSRAQHQLTGHSLAVTSVAFSPDSERLVSGSRDQSLRLFDVGMGQELMCIDSQEGIANQAQFSPDGDEILLRHHVSLSQWRVGDWQASSVSDNQARRAWHDARAQWALTEQLYRSADFHYSQLIGLEPDNAAHLRSRADARARGGRWIEAKQDYLALDDKQLSLFDQMSFARVLLRMGDYEAYRARCLAIRKRVIASKNASIFNSYVWTCSLSREDPTWYEPVLKLLESEYEKMKPGNYATTIALGYYRANRFRDAIAKSNEYLQASVEANLPNNWLIIALSLTKIESGIQDLSERTDDINTAWKLQTPSEYMKQVEQWVERQRYKMLIGEHATPLAVTRMNMDFPLLTEELLHLTATEKHTSFADR